MKNKKLSQAKERDKIKHADSQEGTSSIEITNKFIASACFPVHSLHQ